jgi:hypothetical protein
VTGDGRHCITRVLQVKLSVGSILLVIGAVVAAIALLNLFHAAHRQIRWLIAASVVAWLLSWVISLLGQVMPERWRWDPARVRDSGRGRLGRRSATIVSEVDRYVQRHLPEPATSSSAIARQPISPCRAQSFVNSLDERFGTQAQVTAAAGTASTYIVAGVLMLFLVGYGPVRSAALRQIGDPVRESPCRRSSTERRAQPVLSAAHCCRR